MTPIQLALMCNIAYSPPVVWDMLPVIPGATVEIVDDKRLHEVCHIRDYACTDTKKLIAYIPAYSSWHGTKVCYDEVVRHEMAHLKGWMHPD